MPQIGQASNPSYTPCSLHSNDCWRKLPQSTAPGFLDTRLRYAAWRSSYSSRASFGV